MRRYDGTHDAIRISFPVKEKPNPNEPWVSALAAAVIMRCFRDAMPRDYKNRRDRLNRRQLQREALDWVTLGGDDFLRWCLIAGVEPGRVRTAVVNVSVGVFPDGVDLQRYAGRRL